MRTPVIAIFDIGKTNKKLFLFDGDYEIIFEVSRQFDEVRDDDGDLCEDLRSLKSFVLDSLHAVIADERFDVRAVNFSAYGASFVYLDSGHEEIGCLYNYLKPYPPRLMKQFYDSYGGEDAFSLQCASPVLGSLNSGMQLYRIKYDKPELYKKIEYALHLPQYMSFLVTHTCCSEMTSIGCHTNLWNFQVNAYHSWLHEEDIIEKLPPVEPSGKVSDLWFGKRKLVAGMGLHDSSSALIPYLLSFSGPFVLISTGTWNISLNPFNQHPLTADELKNDCLYYISYTGRPVKASRIFAGFKHDEQMRRIGRFFKKPDNYFRQVKLDSDMVKQLKANNGTQNPEGDGAISNGFVFETRDISNFNNYEEAYHQLMIDIVMWQRRSTQLVLAGTGVKKIFVDGGFGKNEIYMKLLALALPDIQILGATVAEASALGAALAIHNSWNDRPLPEGLVKVVPVCY